MKITDLLSSKTILLNAKANNKKEVIKLAIKTISNSNAIRNLKIYEEGVFNREKESTTGVGEGIAIPHCKSKSVSKPALAALVIKNGVDYDSLDGEKVNLLFLIAAPDNKENVHLEVLARLSNLLMHEQFKNKLIKAKNKTEFINIIDKEEKLFLKKKENEIKKETDNNFPKILAITACPTGIAHTYMSQEALEKAAKKLGYTIKVETNGSAGVKNKLSEEEIENAEGIIVAADAVVETDRFAGKKVLMTSVSKAIHEPEELIKKVLSDSTPIFKGKNKFIKTKEERNAINSESKFHQVYKHAMSGISHMIPLVVGGGILIALSFLIDICCGNAGAGAEFGKTAFAAKLFNNIGSFAFGLMMPILAAFIAYSIAGRPGIAVGLAGGVAANTGGFNVLYWVSKNPDIKDVSAGFLGAMIAGFLAGYIVKLLERATNKMPRSLDGIRPILIYPLVGILLIGCTMFLLNVPFAYINIGFSKGLNWLGSNKLTILLGGLLAMMMATDFGGPINKAAYVFGTALIAQASASTATPEFKIYCYEMMAAVMLGGMVPPFAVGLSTLLFPQKYEKDDRRNGAVTAIMGLGFVTEGVIPYAAKDPIRIIIPCMIGSGIGGALSVTWKCQLMAPHGGIFVFPVMKQIGFYILALIIGTIISTILLGIMKKDSSNPELNKWKGISFKQIFNSIKIKVKERK